MAFESSAVSGPSLRRRSLLVGGVGSAAALATLGQGTAAAAADPPQPSDFDFDTGNIMDFVQPTDELAPNPRAEVVAPMDLPVFIWIGHFTPIAAFDAVAPYHPTAVGIFTRIPRRPSSESNTNRNMNIAIMHAQYQAVKGVLPEQAVLFGQLLAAFGLDPTDESEDPTSPVGIGNLAGKGVAAARIRDGMNILGDAGRRYNLRPFADYTGFVPANTAFELTNPSNWQPQLTPHRRRQGAGIGDKGVYTIQHAITPHIRKVQPYSYRDPAQFKLPPPEFTDHRRPRDYKRSVDAILEVSAGLTDTQKVKAEIFDDKILGLTHSALVKSRHHPELGVHGWVQYQLAHLLATLDASIACWHLKNKFNAVRPFSAVQHVYGHKRVTAWGGPGVGTVTDLPADEWASYLNVGDHSEYPSGSTVTFAAAAQVTRRFFDDDTLNWRFTWPAGRAVIEPGLTPANDLELNWPTWTDFVNECAMSRVWGGVHFPKTVQRSIPFGEQFGDLVYEYVKRHIDGDVD